MVRTYQGNTIEIKVPTHGIKKIVQNKRLFRAVSVYLELKPLFYSSCIKKFRSNYKDLCKYLDISERKLRTELKQLEKLGLCWIDTNKNLHLGSWEKFCNVTGCNKYKKIRIPLKTRAQDILRALAIKESLTNQEHTVKQKIYVNEKLNAFDMFYIKNGYVIPTQERERYKAGIIGTVKRGAHKKQIKRMFSDKFTDSISLEIEYKKRAIRYAQLSIENDNPINTNVTLSTFGIAKLLGNTARSAGHYWSVKLEEIGLLTATTCQIRAEHLERSKYVATDKGVFTKKHSLNAFKRSTFRTMSNKIEVLL